MLKRLELVIHWAGYFGATWITAAVGYQLINIGIEHADLDDWLRLFGFVGVLSVGAIACGWLINFILTGHTSPLPWVKNSENGG